MSVRRSRPSTLRIKNNGFTSKYHYIGKVSVRKPFFFCLFLWFFEIFLQKVLVIPEKALPLHSHLKKCSCDVRLHLSKKRVFCLRFALTLLPKIGVWCNGNTADSGPAFPGSSPGTPTEIIAKSLKIKHLAIFRFQKIRRIFGLFPIIPHFLTSIRLQNGVSLHHEGTPLNQNINAYWQILSAKIYYFNQSTK